MKLLIFLVAITSAFQPFIGSAAEAATGRLWCLSLRFDEGTDSFGDTLDLSTVNGTPNGELAPYNGSTYISGFILNISGQPITGTVQLNLPPFSDVNSNGFDDFFESAIGVGATTSGTYSDVLGGGTITATWQRAAGSPDGTCSLDLVDNTYGDLGVFTDGFHLLEYIGSVPYTPGTNMVTGSINLLQTGNLSNFIQGPFQFTKVPTNHFNLLVLQPGSWSNSLGLALSYTNNLFRRDAPWTTNYYGLVQFASGDPTSPSPDYFYWAWSIDDTNDANQNGIPDFSDDPQTVPRPNPPSLALALNSTNVLLSVSGTVGHLHDIQQALSLPATNWQTVLSVTLTNSPQVITVPYLPLPAVFWRALAH